LSDVYVKAIRWASDRIEKNGEGIVAFISNNSFINEIAFDGARKHLEKDFSKIYHINLKGNARTSGERRKREAGNIFDDQIRVGVGISFFIKTKHKNESTEICIYSVDDYLKSKDKKELLDKSIDYRKMSLKRIIPNKNYVWFSEELKESFDAFLPIGTKESKSGMNEYAIFEIYSPGLQTNHDVWVYNFNREALKENIRNFIEVYNGEVSRWHNRSTRDILLDDFASSDSRKIKWSSRLKECLLQGNKAEFSFEKIRYSTYRPYCFEFLFFDEILIHRQGQFPRIFPGQDSEKENCIICLTDRGSEKPFMALMSNQITDLHIVGAGCSSQCFPFYTYNEDGTNRQENITDWALEKFRAHYSNTNISKWDIFHYVYAVLHHLQYRETYAANLKR
jgi:predicted helicase